MRITIDVQPLLGKKSGVGYYIHGLIQGLADVDDKNSYQLALFDFRSRAHGIELPGPNFRIKRSWIPGRLASFVWKKMKAPAYEFYFGDSDIVHFPNFIIRPIRKGKKIATIHDVSFLRLPQYAEPKNLAFLKGFIEETVKIADEIIVDSEFSRREVLSLFNIPQEKVHAIHLGIGREFRPGRVAKKRMLLFVGTLEPRKNIPGLIRAYERFVQRTGLSEYELVIAGMKGWLYQGILECVEKSPYRAGIKLLDYVSDELLLSLYQSAALFVYPSFYEGFGLPPLEAMACGIPVVSSKTGSLPEVLGDGAHYADPEDIEGLSIEIEKLLLDEKRRKETIDRGLEQVKKYRWDIAARKTIKVYSR